MKEKKKKNWPILIFIIGLAIALYPVFSNYYYKVESDDLIENFQSQANEIDREEIERRIDLAKAYNETLDPSRLADPFSEREKAGRAEYARMLEIEEMIGYIDIPQIDQNLPVYAGTSSDILEKGAGHLEGTSLPIGGESTHAVITAHRGLPRAKLFRELDKLTYGDVFYFHNLAETLAYEVDQIITVEPTNFEPVLVQKGQDYMTLLTCTPYMVNSHRLLVRGHRVPYTQPVEEKPLSARKTNGDLYRRLLIAAIIIIILIIIFMLRNRKKYLIMKKKMEDIKKNK